MRVIWLAVAGTLALTTPMTGHAAPLASSMKQVVIAPGVVKVRGGHPAPAIGAYGEAHGCPALCAVPVLWRLASLWELGSS